MKPTGGQAFPTPHTRIEHSSGHVTEYEPVEGVTVRDYFAAKAMQAEMITSLSDATPESAEALREAAANAGQTIEERIAVNAYKVADAMLVERDKA